MEDVTPAASCAEGALEQPGEVKDVPPAASCAEGAPEQPGEVKETDTMDPASSTSASAAPGEDASELAEGTEFFLKCKGFHGAFADKLQKWLSKESKVDVSKFDKKKHAAFCFVHVSAEHGAAFKEAVGKLSYKGKPISVDEARPLGAAKPRAKRKESAAGEEGEPGAKRHKAADGQSPTLKELRERAKSDRKDDESAVQKAAPLLDYSYEAQLHMKNTFVKTAARSCVKLAVKRSGEMHREPPVWCAEDWRREHWPQADQGCCCALDPPVGAPLESLAGWRNKCEFSIAHDMEGNTEIGFVRRVCKETGKVMVGGVGEVPLVPSQMKRLSAALRSCIEASALPIYDRSNGAKTGIWRMVSCRMAPSGDLLAMVQTTTVEGEARAQLDKLLVASLFDADLGVISLYSQFNDELSDAARPNAEVRLIAGRPRLEMPMLGLRFELGPLSFFNPNTTTCRLLMESTLEFLDLKKTVTLLDIYSGIGTIGLCGAGRCKEVIGVEIVPEAVEMAQANAALNGIGNATFHCGKAENLVPKILGDMSEDVEVYAVVDPSRAGLHPKVISALRSSAQVKRLVYVSCNAESCAEDVAKMSVNDDPEADFTPTRIVAVDSFPQTLHVEVILRIDRGWQPTALAAGTAATDRAAQGGGGAQPDAGAANTE